jgi:hypothetical protein
VAVRQAESLRAWDYSPLDLWVAREELARAERAMDDEDYDRARRLAEQALADAELAAAKVRSERARRRAAHLRRSLEALRADPHRAVAIQPGDDTN